MASAPEPDLEELCWSIACARLVLDPHIGIQAPPNLSPGVLARLVDAGINDWGGVSPLTPDYVNPEAPWPKIRELRRVTEEVGLVLRERLAVAGEVVEALRRTRFNQEVTPEEVRADLMRARRRLKLWMAETASRRRAS